jgi:hypothetical protein
MEATMENLLKNQTIPILTTPLKKERDLLKKKPELFNPTSKRHRRLFSLGERCLMISLNFNKRKKKK